MGECIEVLIDKKLRGCVVRKFSHFFTGADVTWDPKSFLLRPHEEVKAP